MTVNFRLKKLLSESGYSLTKPRQAVFDALLGISEPITIPALCKLIPKADKVSVYRSVSLFEKIGLLTRVSNGFKSRIELSDAFSPHHHHFTCRICSKVSSIESKPLEESLHSLEKTYGFEVLGHSVELSGVCAACRA